MSRRQPVSVEIKRGIMVKKEPEYREKVILESDSESAGFDSDSVSNQLTFLKTVPIIFFAVNRQLKVIDSNDFADQFFAYLLPESERKLSGYSADKLFGNQTKISKHIKRAFEGSHFNKEIPLLGKTGNITPVKFHFSHQRGTYGELSDFVLITGTEISRSAVQEKKDAFWLSKIYEEVPVMIFAIDDRAILRYANKNWLEKTGYARDEVIGTKMKDFLSDESKKIVFGEAIPELLSTGKVRSREVQLKIKDNRMMDVRVSAVRSEGPEGQFMGLVVVEDITEAKQTKESLIESSEKYQKLIEGLPDVVIVTNIFGMIEYISPNKDRLRLRSIIKKIPGEHILQWIDPAFHESFVENIQKLIDGEKYVVGVYDFPTDIEPIHVEVRSTLIHDANGKPRGYISILRDITKYQKAEDDLKLKEQILRRIYDNSADIIWMTDRKNKITFVSKSSEKILGYTPKEAMKLSLDQLQSPEDLELKMTTHRHKFPLKRKPGQQFEPVHLEIRHFHKNGTKIWSDMLSSPLYDENDEFCGLIGNIRDSSERKANELAVRESRELYRSLIELSPEGIIIINKGRIEFANREFVKMLKAETEDQLTSLNFMDLIKLKDHTEVRSWFKRVEAFKADDEVILAEFNRFDGAPLYAEVMATPVTVRGEKSAQLFVRDVTQRILTGKELDKERELNESLIRTIPDYIYFKDLEGKFIKINKSFAEALGLSEPEHAVGKSDKDFFGIRHYRQTQKEENQIIKSKRPLIGVNRKEPWPNADVQWLSVTKMPLYGPDREVIGTFGVSRDISKQKQSEAELIKREERFRQFFAQVQVGVAVIDSKFVIREVNKALCDILKYSQKELIDKDFLMSFHSAFKTELKKQLKNIQSGKAENFHSECELNVRNGNTIHVLFRMIKPDASGELKNRFICQVVDINDRKVAEEQLLIRNNELNNFVYKVSHDLRAPLLSVKGLINLMKIENDPRLYESYTGMIEERVNKLDGFIRDVLSHSKNLNTDVSTEEIDLEEIIENCFAQVHFADRSFEIDKRVSVRGERFYSDPERIREIMRNLISNAAAYSSKERVNSYIGVKVRTGARICTIEVEDNGIGIKKAYLDKIFQMFYRANDRVEGSGIGLYIVQQSVQKLGGKVMVDSLLNSGTKFTLNIPNNKP